MNHPTLLVGTSAGIAGVHDAESIPFDTVTYLLRAEQQRQAMDAEGIFFILDERTEEGSHARRAIVRRTVRLRTLVQKLTPKFRVVTHSKLLEQGLERTLEQTSEPNIEHPELRRYTRLQVATVLHLQNASRNGTDTSFHKFGWILSRRQSAGDSVPVGGEAAFDEHLPADAGVGRLYTAPGYLLNKTDGKAPYLLSVKDAEHRICLTASAEQAEREIAKIKSGISRIAYDTIMATAIDAHFVRAHFQKSHQVAQDNLVHMPLSEQMRSKVTDEKQIETLREFVRVALNHSVKMEF